MKKLVLLIVVSLFYVSNLTAQKNNPYDYVGKEHNKTLDDVYKFLTSNIKNNKNSKDLLKNIDEFFKEKQKSKNKNNAINAIDKVVGFTNYIPLKNLSEYFNKLEKLYNQRLSEEYKKIAYQIERYTKQNNKAELSKLVNQVKNNEIISNKEKEALLSSIAISYNSIEYWNNNTRKWENIISNNKSKKPWWKVAAVDGVVGAFGIGAGLLSGGIAWGATGWAAARASAVAAVMIQ